MHPHLEDMKQAVTEQFGLPYEPYDWQWNTAYECFWRKLSLNEADVGYGKTIMSICTALYASIEHGAEQILVLMPPHLISQYAEFIHSVKGIDKVVIYDAPPKKRKEMRLDDAAVIVMSYNIFRIDYDRVYDLGLKSKLFILADELSLKSMGQTYKKLKKLIYRKQRLKLEDKPFHELCAMNATPVSDQIQVYNWLSIMAPEIYRTQRIFKNIHVGHEDTYGRVTQWKEPERLADNFSLVRVKPPPGLIKLPPLIPTTVPYTLSKKHMALYKKVVKGEFQGLPAERVELAVKSLFSTLQRLAFCPEEWGVEERPAVFDVIDGYLDQIGNNQALFFTRHKAVTRMLGEYVPSSVMYYGDISKKQKEENYRRFEIGDAQFLVANIDSLSTGKNMQFCKYMLVTELPYRPDAWTQMTGRIQRQGQTETTFVHIPLAKGTVQQKIYRGLIDKDFDLRFLAKDRKRLKEFLEIV